MLSSDGNEVMLMTSSRELDCQLYLIGLMKILFRDILAAFLRVVKSLFLGFW